MMFVRNVLTVQNFVYFLMSINCEVFVFPHRSSITLNIRKKIICSHTVDPSGKPGKNGNFEGILTSLEKSWNIIPN